VAPRAEPQLAAHATEGLGGHSDLPETRLVSNTVVQVLPPATRALTGVVLASVLARYLGVRGYGEYGLAFAYVAIFAGVFNDWGLAFISLREVSRHPVDRSRILWSAASLQAGISAMSYGALLVSLLLVGYPVEVKAAAALIGLTVFFAPIDLLALSFHADLRQARVVWTSMIGSVASLLLVLAAVALHASLVAVVIGGLLGLFAQYALLARLALGATPFTKARLTAGWIPLLRESWSIGVNTVFTAVGQQAPLMALSSISVASVGLYAAAGKIPMQLVLIPLIIRGSTVPLLSRSWAADPLRFVHQLRLLVALSSLGGVGLALLGVGLAPALISVLFGPAFAGAAPALAWLMVMVAILLPGILLGEVLIVSGNQRINLAIQAGSLPILAVLLVWLLPWQGASGAAGALALTQAAMALATLIAVRVVVGAAFPLGWVGSAGLAAAAGAATLLLAEPVIGDVLAALAAAAIGLAIGGYFERASVAWLVARLSATWLRQSPALAPE
jgi:O-antigen/teichoic acid export membrane protein